MAYIHRVIEKKVTKYLSAFPVVAITGPRQSGKSTMLQEMLDMTYEYVTFDDERMVHTFHDDPERFLRTHNAHVIFDEVQKVPELFNYLKIHVDRDRQNYGKFVVTGSSQFQFMKGVSESLAGRIGLLSLLPFQFSEIPAHLREESVFRGGYPEMVVGEYRFSDEWYASYIDTYITRDVRLLSNIGDVRDFRRCIQLLSGRVAQLLNMSELAREIGVSVPTVKRWISILEASYIVFLLSPYYKNLGKRIVKSPKLYFYDTGLVSYLTGIANTELFEKGPMAGPLFENYIVSEIRKRELHSGTGSTLYFYRTSSGVEIDVVIDRRVSREYVEIKSSESFKPQMMHPIEKTMKKSETGVLVYRGETLKYDDAMSVVNYREYLAVEA